MYYLWFHRLLYGFVWQFKATIRWRLSTKSKVVLFGVQRLQGQLFRIWEVLFAKVSKRPNTCKFTWVLHRSIGWKRARVFNRLCSSYQSIDTGNYIRLHFFLLLQILIHTIWWTNFIFKLISFSYFFVFVSRDRNQMRPCSPVSLASYYTYTWLSSSLARSSSTLVSTPNSLSFGLTCLRFQRWQPNL